MFAFQFNASLGVVNQILSRCVSKRHATAARLFISFTAAFSFMLHAFWRMADRLWRFTFLNGTICAIHLWSQACAFAHCSWVFFLLAHIHHVFLYLVFSNKPQIGMQPYQLHVSINQSAFHRGKRWIQMRTLHRAQLLCQFKLLRHNWNGVRFHAKFPKSDVCMTSSMGNMFSSQNWHSKGSRVALLEIRSCELVGFELSQACFNGQDKCPHAIEYYYVSITVDVRVMRVVYVSAIPTISAYIILQLFLLRNKMR